MRWPPGPPAVQATATVGSAGCSAVIDDATLGTATASDNCPGAVTITRSGVPAGNAFPVGTTTITWTATDGNGNIASVTQEVHVTGAPGNVAGRVTAECPAPDTGLLGVRVDAFDSSGAHIGTAVTNTTGAYQIAGLPAGDPLTVTVVTPLGYHAANEDVPVLIECGETIAADFTLSCVAIMANQRSSGYWKHQAGVATGGPGSAQVDGPTLCSYLDLIGEHFNPNALNQVIVYQAPASGLCSDKLKVANELLNLKGNASMTARAREQLMSLLLNVAGGYVGQQHVVSADGATVSQAITYCDHLIDGPTTGHETAKTIADRINNNLLVGAGVIPLSTQNISYRHNEELSTPSLAYSLGGNQPNPFLGRTVLSYTLAGPSAVRLSVYDASGRVIRTLSEGASGAGLHEVTWDGRDASGAKVSAGVYLCRLEARPEGGAGVQTFERKLTVVR